MKPSTSIRLIQGVVASVDKVRWTCSVHVENGPTLNGVPIAPVYLGNEAEGIYYVPKVGTWVTVVVPHSNGVADADPFILCAAVIAADKDDPDDEIGVKTDLEIHQHTGDPDYRADRPVLGEGDIRLSAGEGNFVTLRAGGVVELGSSQIAQRFYIPIQNMIRDIASIYKLNAAGGELSWHTRRGEEGSWGTVTQEVVTDSTVGDDSKEEIEINKTPTVLELNIREFAQDAPVINLQMGRIEPDYEAGLTADSAWEDIVFAFSVGEGLEKKFKFWIDKNGNTAVHQVGEHITSYENDQKAIYQAGNIVEMEGRQDIYAGSRNVELGAGDDRLVIHGNQGVTIHGNKVEEIDGEESGGGTYQLTTSGPTMINCGEFQAHSTGAWAASSLGFAVLSVGTDAQVSAGGNWNECIGGDKSVNITNSNFATGSLQAYSLTSMAGEISLHAGAVSPGTGSVSITCGAPIIGSLTPFSKVEVTALAATVSFAPLAGTGVLECNATGVGIRSTAFEVSCGTAGVTIGPVGSGAAPAAGQIVTTVTRPTCYVTGAPILGVANVGIVGPPGPPLTPAVPSGMIPTYAEKVELS